MELPASFQYKVFGPCSQSDHLWNEMHNYLLFRVNNCYLFKFIDLRWEPLPGSFHKNMDNDFAIGYNLNIIWLHFHLSALHTFRV